MISTQIYVLCIFIAVLAVIMMPVKTRITRTSIEYTCFIVAVILIITFRSSKMADYVEYKDAFLTSGQLRFEPIFHVIKALVSPLGNYLIGFLLIAFISVWLKFYCIKKYMRLFWPMSLVYVSNILIVQDMVAIRAGLAGSFLLVALQYKFENKIKKMILFLLLSFFSHYTAIVFVLLFFMDAIKFRRWFYLLLIVFSYALSMKSLYATQLLHYLPFVGDYFVLFDKYMEEAEYQVEPMNIFNLLQMGHVLICVVFWCYINRIQKLYPSALVYLKLYTIGVCSVCWFAQSFAMAIRFSELFFVVEILLVPIGFSALFRKSFYFKLVLIIYAVVVFYFRMSDYMYWDPARLSVI